MPRYVSGATINGSFSNSVADGRLAGSCLKKKKEGEEEDVGGGMYEKNKMDGERGR